MHAGALNETVAVSGDIRPVLPSVTLIAVSSIALEATVVAMKKSLEQVEFGSAVLLSDRLPPIQIGEIEWRRVRPIVSRQDYSRFMLQELSAHVTTDYALCIQWDGYVVAGGCWRDEFMHYDYVGAPWPHFPPPHRVGNGGFSLRSKRLLDACASLPASDDVAEDVAIGRVHRKLLEDSFGIRYAPEPIARHFAFERCDPTGSEFGFHGIFNLMALMRRADFARLLASLEPGVIGRLEAREIFWRALARADIPTARAVMANRLAGRASSKQVQKGTG